MEDMLRCLDCAIAADLKPGVRVLNAVEQKSTLPPGVSVADVLRGWWGAEVADAIPGLASLGDANVWETATAEREIGFLVERRVEVVSEQPKL